MKLGAKCNPIKLLLCDVDGVMTDGGVVIDNQGVETKRFHIRDGLGIRLWRRAGYQAGLITGRNSHIVQLRAAEMSLDLVRQGVDDKLSALTQILEECAVTAEQVCFIGDDLLDLPVIRAVGLGIAVADAAEEVRKAADYTTSVPGGSGAVREAVEVILKNQGRWDDLIRKYLGT
jgi:YrbI family 3-deoxy-D-manno-octulosonate 8-phosphate phosphatase